MFYKTQSENVTNCYSFTINTCQLTVVTNRPSVHQCRQHVSNAQLSAAHLHQIYHNYDANEMDHAIYSVQSCMALSFSFTMCQHFVLLVHSVICPTPLFISDNVHYSGLSNVISRSHSIGKLKTKLKNHNKNYQLKLGSVYIHDDLYTGSILSINFYVRGIQ